MLRTRRSTATRTLASSACALSALAVVAGCTSSSKHSAPPVSPSVSATSSDVAATVSTGQPAGIAALPGYKVTVFARSAGTYSNPDSVEIVGRTVFVGYQNSTAKDGSDKKTSTIVEYSPEGSVKGTWPAIGHNDGLRMDPSTHRLWALSDEDANPLLTVIDPGSGNTKVYKFPKTAHGGGYDDIVFMKGMTYMSASNPNIVNGTNTAPAVVRVKLNDASGAAAVTPVLMGNAKASDGNGGTVTLDMVDPDSMFISPAGDLTVDNQQGTALVSIHNPGAGQVVTQTLVGTQVDDTVYTPKTAGRLLLSDTAGNTVYGITDSKNAQRAYVATPNDSGVAGFVGILRGSIITPAIIGFLSPHGMGFLPSAR